MHSLTTTLQAVSERLPRPLVSHDSLRRLEAVVDHLPAALSKMIYFECRLRDAAPRVDLVLAIYPRGAAIMARHELADAGLTPNWWMRLQAFCRRWMASASLRSMLDHIWLEYDVAAGPDIASAGARRAASVVPEPGIFISLVRLSSLRPDRPSAWFDHVLTAVESIATVAVARSVRDALHICIKQLPPAAAVAYVGLMTHRPRPTIRVCLANVPASSVMPYVADVASTSPRHLDTAIRLAAYRHTSNGERCVPMLHLDISPTHGILPRVGLERLFSRPSQRHGRIAGPDRQLLALLNRSGACTEDKRNALLKWPGRSVAVLPHELWWSLIDRRVNHLKFVLDGDRAFDVKAYLLLSYLCHSSLGRAANRAALGN